MIIKKNTKKKNTVKPTVKPTTTKKTKNSNDNSSKPNYFITQSRLNRGQRKYCHCIMKLRSKNKTQKQTTNTSHYPVCKKLTNDFANQYQKNMKLKPNDYNPYQFNLNKTNCIMNYDYSKYSLKDIQAFCVEKEIPISFKSKGKKQHYSKDKLVEKLVKTYLSNKLQT